MLISDIMSCTMVEDEEGVVDDEDGDGGRRGG